MQRVNSIDYLRGLLACSVMIYHYISWSIGVPDSGTILGRLGIYEVSSFYIISGISLHLVYAKTSWNTQSILHFVIKRVFRIAPLYWVATIATITFFAIKPGPFLPDWEKLISNFTLTFGFFAPHNYIPTGGWSIGNEMVFYAMFPALMLLMTSRAWSITLGLLAFTGIYIYFAFHTLTPGHTLADQWKLYINPFNQALLFTLGIAIGSFSKKYQTKKQSKQYIVLAVSLLTFALWPASGNQINIVTEYNRLAFTAICGAICWAALNIALTIDGIASQLLKYLGDTSYSIYLLHGVIHLYTISYIYPLLSTQPSAEGKLYFLLFVSGPTTLIASYFVHRLIEQPVIRLGKQLTKSMATQRTPEPQNTLPPPNKG